MDDRGTGKKDPGYEYIIARFGEDKVLARSSWLYDLLQDYIEIKGLGDRVDISEDILKHVLIDYFVDIDRLKEFADISKANDSKIYAYTCFWMLRHKPLQVKNMSDCQDLVFVNEDFVANLLRGYLFSNPENVPIMNNVREDVDNFVSTLVYYFKYRDYSAKSIEMIILAFGAGKGYQYSVDHQNA